MRSSIVDALYTKNGYWYIVVSPSSINSTYIITVDCTTGNPLYTGIPFLDIFPDHESAIEALTEIGAVRKVHGEGFLGLVSNETTSTFAIIDKVQVTAKIPPNHVIKTVNHTSFINIPLIPNSPKISIYEDFQINYNHFFCDTYDLTRLFPVKDINSPDYGFVWNNGWRKPFEILGIPQVCTNLIQGVCVSKEFINFRFSLAYVCRRSVLNPGTRYAARGLNDLNSPGNEVECELIFFKGDQFWSERWRRGSIPIRWKTVLSSKLATPKHRVDKDYFKGTIEYFKGLLDRYGSDTVIRCVSLLQTESDHSESQIKDFFKKALSRLFENGIENVFLTPFDLNRHLHEDGSGEAMMDFLSYIGPLSESDGFTHGTLPCSVAESQKGLMRFNCADSLDRTNLATFYYAMKMTADWCKSNSTGLSATPNADPFLPNLIIHQSIIDFLARVFVESGNVVSQLYTNTQAIKTNAIKKFAPSIVVTTNDTNISVQRRLQNVMIDPARQKVIELWTQPMPLSWYHRIDARHIFIVPSEDSEGRSMAFQFPRTVFSPLFRQIDIKQKELVLCLPSPMILFSFMILVYPANQNLRSLSVRGGMTVNKMEKIMETFIPAVEKPIWLRFRPNNAVRFGFEKSPKRYIRFLSLFFETPDDSFSIGNIRVEARSVFCGEAATSTESQTISLSKSQISKSMSPSRSSPSFSSNASKNDLQKQNESSLLASQNDQNNEHNGLIKSISMQPSVPKSATIDGLNDEMTSKSEITDNLSVSISDNIDDNDANPIHQETDENSIERFTQSFDKFVRSPQNLANVLELEKARVGLGLDEKTRVQIAINKGVSPWVADSRARLATINLKECPFCKFSHTEGVKYYCPSAVFPGLIKTSKFHEKGGFPVCKGCSDIADIFSNITVSYELQYALTHHNAISEEVPSSEEKEAESEIESDDIEKVDEDEVDFSNEQSKRQRQIDQAEARRRHDKKIIPHFGTCDINRELCKGLQASTHEANACFLNEESSLLWLEGGSEKLSKDEERKYDMFIVQMAVVLKLVITVKSSENQQEPFFDVLDFHGNCLSFKKLDSPIIKGDDLASFEFHFDEQPITQRLKFTIRAKSDIEMTNLQAFYIITKLPPEEVILHKSDPLKLVPLSGSYPSFNMTNRTDSIKLSKLAKVTKMLVEFVVEKSSTTPYSFYLCFYRKNQLVDSMHYVLPEVSNGTKLWYNISNDGIETDTVKVFYVDRIASIKPHVLRFVFK